MRKFRDMADYEQLEIIENKQIGSVDEYLIDGWVESDNHSINLDGIYRIRLRPMSIDWSVLKDEYVCAARDKNGDASAYTRKPREYAIGCFDSPDGDLQCITGLKSYDPGTVDWTESLIWRPGYANKN